MALILNSSLSFLKIIACIFSIGNDLSFIKNVIVCRLCIDLAKFFFKPVSELVEESTVLFVSVWGNFGIWALCDINVVGIVVIDLLESCSELISAIVHSLLKLSLLVSKSLGKGGLSFSNDVFHV